MPVLALQEKPSSANPTGGAANATQNATQKTRFLPFAIACFLNYSKAHNY